MLTFSRHLLFLFTTFSSIGLCFEPFQDGIKKDPTTFSYFFVTSGLAFLALLFLSIVCDYFRCVKSTRFLVMSGQNPMIAYVVGDLLIMPLANILGIASLLYCFTLIVIKIFTTDKSLSRGKVFKFTTSKNPLFVSPSG